jgi:hypothetical protein
LPKLFCNKFVVKGQYPHADLGCRIIETSGIESPIRRDDIDHIAGNQITADLLDIPGIDPEMPPCLGRSCARKANASTGTVIMKCHGVLIQWHDPNVKLFSMPSIT